MQDWRSRLRESLAKSGMTRSQVCRKAGVNVAYLTQILETKGSTPRIDNLAKIAAVVGTNTTYLVDGVDMSPDAVDFLALFTTLDEGRKEAVLVMMRDLAECS